MEQPKNGGNEQNNNVSASAADTATIKANATASVADAQKTKANAEASTADAATTKNNATISTTDTQKTKGNAESSAANAKLAGENATASTAGAATVKANVTASTTDAEKTKDNAGASTTDAAKTKANATESTTDAQKTKGNAETSTADAATTKNNAAVSTADAQKTKGNADASTTDAATAKTQAAAAQASAKTANDNAGASGRDAAIVRGNAQTATAETANVKTAAASAAEELAKATQAREKAELEAKEAARAHNMSTTVGLAGAFTDKARKATINQYVWVVALVASLIAVGVIAWKRFDTVAKILQDVIADHNQSLLSTIGIEILLSGLGLGAPLWFAWISSKMISKYFHLSEDYAYKAVLSKAYLGFKEQAHGLDQIFEERLFAAAITQLDANPLRFFDSGSHPGSPLQDLLQQPFMQSALNNPTFKEGFVGWMNRVFRTNFYLPKIPGPVDVPSLTEIPGGKKTGTGE